jgi:hypothetical protein
MIRKFVSVFSVLGFVFAASSFAAKPSVYFITPKDGATVGTKFDVKFGVKGMKILPAGKMDAGTGHHHLIVNGTAVEKGQVVTKDETHLHFGQGQSETTLTLKPGAYKLTLQFADGAHISYGPDMSKTITVTVKE